MKLKITVISVQLTKIDYTDKGSRLDDRVSGGGDAFKSGLVSRR